MSMIKGIKGGFSHAKKDKIKIQYDIEFQSLSNLPNDFNGHSLSIKWERGKNKGETKECKIQKPKTTTTTSNHHNNDHLKPTADNALVPIGKNDSMSKKQSKLLIGSRLADTAMVGGDCSAIINEHLSFKITLFSDTQVSKDNSLTPNYEQKLMTLSILIDNTTRSTTLVDLSMHSENNGSSPINIPFPSSSSLQPTLNLTIKTNYLKYNEKKIIKTSPPDSASMTTPHKLNGANNLREIEGKVYLIGGTTSESDPPSESITRSNSWDEETDYTFQNNKDTFLRTTVENKELSERLQVAEKSVEEFRATMESKDRSIKELTSNVEVCHARVMEYEEQIHRVQVLHDRILKELNKERADFLNYKQLVASGKRPESPGEESSSSSGAGAAKSTELLALEQLNDKLKVQLQTMEEAWKEEKGALEESNDKLTKLFQESKEKASSLRTALEKELAKSNASDIKESELRKRITQEHAQEQHAKQIQQQPSTTQEKVRAILMKPLVAWFITVLMIMYLIFGDSC
ncbi:hypothetical protein SAMD00019534_007290, partial [Acytostelium subglobosum LB1]|uniref:hypothetical protein n=1 Tax=Acytostelium subglobosum LB1 TaxID=1410327 RepID=UPI000644BC55